jgi:hypothetical protein
LLSSVSSKASGEELAWRSAMAVVLLTVALVWGV